jgi:hypothetical protein
MDIDAVGTANVPKLLRTDILVIYLIAAVFFCKKKQEETLS